MSADLPLPLFIADSEQTLKLLKIVDYKIVLKIAEYKNIVKNCEL